jgi:predicted glycoside hydrolase/deacetylase ChbG (UPF0249 family)
MTDLNGYLFHNGRELFDNHPAGGRQGPDLAEVEREMRAQIQMIKRRIPRVAWIWPHQLVAYSRPDLRSLTERLGQEYGLPLLGARPEMKDVKVLNNWADFRRPDGTYDSDAMAHAYIKAIRDLQPGMYFTITHPALDTEEVHALRPADDTAARRSAQVRTLVHPDLLYFIKQRGIELISSDEAARVF